MPKAMRRVPIKVSIENCGQVVVEERYLGGGVGEQKVQVSTDPGSGRRRCT